MENENKNVLQVLAKYWKPIALAAIIGGVSAFALVSPWLVKPLYKSETIIYPPATNNVKYFIDRDPRFGSDKEIEEQIQILNSNILRDTIIKKYDLIKHYEIDTTSKSWKFSLLKQYISNIKIERNRHNAIVITVYDTDPQHAANIANDIVKIGDIVKNKIIKSNLRNLYVSIENQFNEQVNRLDSHAVYINAFAKMQLIKFSKASPMNEDLGAVKMHINNLLNSGIYSSDMLLTSLLQDYLIKLQRLDVIQQNYNQALSIMSSDIPACYQISSAEPVYKKAYPPRTFIALAGAAVGFLLLWLYYLLKEKYFQLV